MPIYHISGKDLLTPRDRSLYVEARSLTDARRFALQRDIADISIELVEHTDVPESTPILPAGAGNPRGAGPGESKLHTEPILTIALGVFCGMVIYSVVTFGLALFLSALGMSLSR
jgi:hypothetical protein